MVRIRRSVQKVKSRRRASSAPAEADCAAVCDERERGQWGHRTTVANALRCLCANEVGQQSSGHLGSLLGFANIAVHLMNRTTDDVAAQAFLARGMTARTNVMLACNWTSVAQSGSATEQLIQRYRDGY